MLLEDESDFSFEEPAVSFEALPSLKIDVPEEKINHIERSSLDTLISILSEQMKTSSHHSYIAIRVNVILPHDAYVKTFQYGKIPSAQEYPTNLLVSGIGKKIGLLLRRKPSAQSLRTLKKKLLSVAEEAAACEYEMETENWHLRSFLKEHPAIHNFLTDAYSAQISMLIDVLDGYRNPPLSNGIAQSLSHLSYLTNAGMVSPHITSRELAGVYLDDPEAMSRDASVDIATVSYLFPAFHHAHSELKPVLDTLGLALGGLMQQKNDFLIRRLGLYLSSASDYLSDDFNALRKTEPPDQCPMTKDVFLHFQRTGCLLNVLSAYLKEYEDAYSIDEPLDSTFP